MCRINPKKKRQPRNYKYFWILNPTPDEIRPYTPEALIFISYEPFFSVKSNISWILFTNSIDSSGKYWLPWQFKSFVAFFTEIPWLDVIYSPPSKSNLKAKNDVMISIKNIYIRFIY